jgi:hypothetical protein
VISILSKLLTAWEAHIRDHAGYFLVYPLREAVIFLNDSDKNMKEYFMGLKKKAHRFCPECSSSILIDFQNSDVVKQRKYLAINVRTKLGSSCVRWAMANSSVVLCLYAAMLNDFDIGTAELTLFDGRNRLQPAYEG